MNQRLLAIALSGLLALGLYSTLQERRPDPGLIDLAVRSTVFALPSATPHVIERVVEVTRLIEVTRLVEVTRMVQVTVGATPAPPLTSTATPVPTLALATPAAQSIPATDVVRTELQAPNGGRGDQAGGCPLTSNREYALIPALGGATHPDVLHGDLNLALRGYSEAQGAYTLVDINGPTDGDAPQLAGVLGRNDQPSITALYRVGDWDWTCGDRGCRGNPIATVEASALALATQPGAPIHVPQRGPEIYGGGFVALVLYAEPTRLTVVYTRDDSVANGYAVHLEGLCVDAALVARYRAANASGRTTLPAVRNGEPVGTAASNQIVVAVRDRGTFKDPRSRKDWWNGF